MGLRQAGMKTSAYIKTYDIDLSGAFNDGYQLEYRGTLMKILLVALLLLSYSAFSQSTDGYQNTSFGSNSGGYCKEIQNNCSGNTSIGFGALSNNTLGSGNTSLGSQAMIYSVSASENTAIGVETLANNLSGGGNAGLGVGVLQDLTTGGYNTGSGYAALSASNGNYNVAVGNNTLDQNQRGSNNIALGPWAGHTNYSGSNNVYIAHVGMANESGIVRIGTAGKQTQVLLIGVDVIALLNAQAAEIKTLQAQVTALQKLK